MMLLLQREGGHLRRAAHCFGGGQAGVTSCCSASCRLLWGWCLFPCESEALLVIYDALKSWLSLEVDVIPGWNGSPLELRHGWTKQLRTCLRKWQKVTVGQKPPLFVACLSSGPTGNQWYTVQFFKVHLPCLYPPPPPAQPVSDMLPTWLKPSLTAA